MKTLYPAAAAALALFASIGGPAAAQTVRTSYYYEQTFTDECVNVSVCRLDFAVTPADALIEFTHLSCNIRSFQPLRLANLGVTAALGSSLIIRSQKIPLGDRFLTSDEYYYGIYLPIRFLVGANRYPFFSVTSIPTATTRANIDCTLVGTPRAPE